MDNHQAFNVSEMVSSGGGRAIAQSSFTPVELAKQIQKMALLPETLQNAAKAAKSCGRPNAVHDLADLVESFGRVPLMDHKQTQENGLGFSGPTPAMAKDMSA
jgi:UDP-N-acetylglucosamine--N-acetylmuramyl-(pentapeptide) pyrophosphoryl-undecaprenol N-acetylglucosamine transferase